MTTKELPKFFVGYGEDGRTPVVNGGYLLYMKDSQGLSLDVAIGVLEDKGWAFDVVGYFAACNLNPNYSMDASLRMLKAATEVEHHERFEAALVLFLDNQEKFLQKYENQNFQLI